VFLRYIERPVEVTNRRHHLHLYMPCVLIQCRYTTLATITIMDGRRQHQQQFVGGNGGTYYPPNTTTTSSSSTNKTGPRAKCDQVVFEAIAKAAEIVVASRCWLGNGNRNTAGQGQQGPGNNSAGSG